MQQVDVVQVENMRFAVRARDVEVAVDRSPEDGGTGPGFRSGELVLGGLGTCSLGGMVVFARNTGIPIDGLRARVRADELTAPKRLDRIRVEIELAQDVTDRQFASLQRIANSCKIHHTLTHGPEIGLALTRPSDR